MKRQLLNFAILALFILGGLQLNAQNTVMVGGEAMYPMKTLLKMQ